MLEIRSLGGLSVTLDGAPLAGLASRKATALLLYLAYTQTSHSREVLAEFLWEEQSQDQALGNLRVALASLKAQIGDYLEITRQALAWNAARPTYLDALELKCAADTALAAREHGRTLREDEQSALDRVLAAYRGDFLHGFYLKDSAAFEEWASLEREALRRLAAEALCSLADHAFGLADYRTAARRAAQLLSIDPTREECHRKAMLALALAGDRSGALAQYERCRRVLAEELAVEPEAETLQLYHQIRDGKLLGRSRMGDWEAVVSRAPPAAVDNTALAIPKLRELPRPMPAKPLTSFLGREADVAALLRLLASEVETRGSAAVITLCGPGGCGKTRLALEVASAAGALFPDGAVLLDVAAVPEEGLLPGALARALDVPEQPGALPLDTVLAVLENRRQLVILDGCEVLPEAAGKLAVAIRRAAPGVRVLATSQTPLGATGETRWLLSPLSAPEILAALAVTPEDAARFPAVQVFVDRARAVDREFELTEANVAAVVRICRQLDGLPLALELAAAWVKLLTPQQIADRLDDIFRLFSAAAPDSRHGSLLAAMAWSCSLLSENERILLRRLAVFRGQFTLEAAERVCAFDEAPALDVLPLLGLLVDKSFVVTTGRSAAEPARYRLLEVVRQYVVEWLDTAGEAKRVRCRHLAFYRDAAEALEDRLRGPEQVPAAQQIERDYDNIREALIWGLTCSDVCVDDALRLAAALGEYWVRADRLDEAHTWLTRALSQLAVAPAALQARVHSAAGTVAWLRGDYVEANARHAASLKRWEEAGDRAGSALALNNLATVACYEDKLGLAASQFGEALTIYEELGDTRGIASVMIGLNFLAGIREDYDASRRYGERSLPLWRRLGDSYQLALVLHNLGDVARLQGDFERAAVFLEESIALCRVQGNRRLMMMSLTALGRMALRRGDPIAALGHFREGLVLSRDLGDRRWLAEQVEALAEVAVARQQWPRAARLFGGAMTLLAAMGASMWLPDLPEHLAAVEQTMKALDYGQFEAEWATGSAMMVERLYELGMAAG